MMKHLKQINRNSKRCLLCFSLFFSIILMPSCDESVLDEVPKGFLTPINAYTTPSGAEQGINGLHAKVRDFFVADNKNTAIMTVLGTDEAYFGEDPAGGTMTNYTTHITPTSGIVSYFWDEFYLVIQRANVLIDNIEASDINAWESEAQRAALSAEAKFFRAFMYRNLVTMWGDVPIVRQAVDYAKTDFTRDAKVDVYAFIEEDLTFATANLPAPGEEKSPGRITKGAAWNLLSEVYLAQSKFQQAADAASHVINDFGYALMTNRFGTKLGNDIFGSGDVYFDLFQRDNHNLTENKEDIWVIQLEANIVGGGKNPGERIYGPAYYRMGNTPDGKIAFRGEFYNGAYIGYSDTLGRPVAWCRPTNYVAYDIWKGDWNNDIRNAKHNIKRDFYFDNPASIYHGQKIDWSLYPPGARSSVFKDTTQYIFPYFMKIAAPLDHQDDPARAGGGSHYKDFYAMRLAETYLIRAEAYLGLNQKDKAADDINMVRNRAKATPVQAANVTINYILDERARELYAEEWRYITLMRLNMLVARVQQYNDCPSLPGLGIQDFNSKWPIPQSQIDLNIDAEIPQNEGYN